MCNFGSVDVRSSPGRRYEYPSTRYIYAIIFAFRNFCPSPFFAFAITVYLINLPHGFIWTKSVTVCLFRPRLKVEYICYIWTQTSECYLMVYRVCYGRRFAARYARSKGRIKQNANEADIYSHDFGCKLTACKCQELHAPG